MKEEVAGKQFTAYALSVFEMVFLEHVGGREGEN